MTLLPNSRIKRQAVPILLALVSVLAFWSGPVDGAILGTVSDKSDSEQARQQQEQPDPVPLVPNRSQRMLQGRLNRLYAFDKTPLGGRMPLILVPGHAQEFQNHAWWQKFKSQTEDSPGFDSRYKLYVYLYNSNEELPVQSAELVQGIRRYFINAPAPSKQMPSKKVVFVGYSLGGIIVRQAMEDAEVFRATDVAFAVATPFHGSPIFNSRWFSKAAQPMARSPIRKGLDRLLYSGYFLNKVNLIRYLQWDNFDGSMPQFNELSEKEQVQLQMASYQARSTDALDPQQLKKKLIIYASFLDNSYVAESNSRTTSLKTSEIIVNRIQTIPKVTIGYVLPYYGSSVHSAMTYVNGVMSNLPTRTESNHTAEVSLSGPKSENRRLYKYNDGVIPLSSMLFLPPRAYPYDEDFKTMVEASDVSMVRIFPNLDHLDIGEYRMSRKRLTVSDLMHPEDGERSPNAWILYDLQARPGELL